MKFRTIIPVLLMGLALSACKQKDKNLDNLMDELVSQGYTGKFERPGGTMEKAALGLFGVNDYLAFDGEQENFVVIDFRSEERALNEDRIESLIKLLETHISSDNEKDFQHIRENWRDHFYQNKNFVVAWEKHKPEKVLEIVGRY
jgi:hypothetical protein